MSDTPTQSMLVALAESAAAAINAATIAGQPILPAGSAAVQEFAPLVDLSGVGSTLLVYIIPLTDAEVRVGGGPAPVFDGHYSVVIETYKKIAAGPAGKAEAAACMLVRQDIRDLLKRTQLAVQGRKLSHAVVEQLQPSREPAYSHSRLNEEGVMLTTQTVAFRMGV
jgi:hypothetical protein